MQSPNDRPVRAESEPAPVFAARLLLFCSRFPYSAPAELTIDELDLVLAASRYAETARDMAPAARANLADLTNRLSRLLTAKRAAVDAACSQLAGAGTFPKGAPGTRPVAPVPPAPDLPPTATAVPPRPAAVSAPVRSVLGSAADFNF